MTTLRVTWAESAVQEALKQLIDWRDHWPTVDSKNIAGILRLQTIQIAIDALRATEQPDTVPTPPGMMICPDCNGMGEISKMEPHPPYNETTQHCYRCEYMSGFVPIDHTSGVMRCRYRAAGGHVHCTVFGPYSGKAGDLVIRIEEWNHFRTTNAGWHFIDWDAVDATPMAWQ